MSLKPGQTLAHYRIVDKIGSGGMGEVWEAEDTKLQRKVAIKVLPAKAAADEHLRARFEREARAIAALNHPNIVTIHAVEETDGLVFLAMELLKGEPLTKHLKEAMPLERFFSVAIPMVDAVAAAHEKGILHRDVKPDNVMLTSDGSVKVLDFGLAKLRDEPEEEAPPSSRELTREGNVVGTTAYMSPEQAEGMAVGPQSDVFALGILLYQMATGNRPFRGRTTVSMISSILKDQPELVTEVNPDLPTHLGRIIRRCLEKDKSRRYSTAGELHTELVLLREELAEVQGDPERAAPKSKRVSLATFVMVAAALGALAVAGWLRGPQTATRPVPRFVEQTFYGGVETQPSLSPNGELLVYVATSPDGDTDLFLQRVEGRNPIDLTADSPADESSPAFSPDGNQIAFRSERDGGGIFVMGATGEAIRRLTQFGYDPAWSPDGSEIVFATEEVDDPLARYTQSELWVVTVATGDTRQIFEGDAVQPSWSPRGGRIAFWTSNISGRVSGQRDLVTIRLDGSDLVMVTEDVAIDWRPVWHPRGGALFFCSDRGGSMNLWRIGVDEATGRPRGPAEPFTTPSLWSGPFAVDGSGQHLAYVARDERSRLMGVPFDAASAALAGDAFTITEGALIVWMFDPSPDGEWIAFDNRGRQEDLYLVRPDGSGLRKVTDDIHKDRGVSWWGDRLVFYSTRSGGFEIWTVRKDGSDPRRLTQTDGYALWLPQVTADGKRLLAHNSQGTYVFELTSGQEPLRKEDAHHVGTVAGTSEVFGGFHWSPDGTRILGIVGEPLTTALAVYDLRDETFLVFEPPETDGIPAAIGWLPDGRRFLGTAAGWLWAVDLDSRAWQKLPLQVASGNARLSADGTMLYYVEVLTQADIWIARLYESPEDGERR